MISRDEEGFLSEWVAYYQMHGFDHFVFNNDGSTDDWKTELKPWIDAGMITIVSNWTADSLNVAWGFKKNEFKKAMTMKALLESNCKRLAISWGYKFYVSLDIDEYMISYRDGETLVDTLDYWATETGRTVNCISKNNFGSQPHILEPVNLLSIEAYQSRMPITSKMNYYTSTAAKCAYKLNGTDFSANTSSYIADCCHFHGCQGWDFRGDTKFCTENHKVENYRVNGHKKKWMDLFMINHYSRSLEKYGLKSKTWTTATGEAKPGESSEQAAKSYDIPKFLSRNVGWQVDRSALKYTCQLREQLKKMTGEATYLRPGTQWYRNPEFAKEITDPDKRGRYGRPNQPGFKYAHKNPYHYHGQKLKLD
jgi:hypothetical protein